jgi:hypothetical protein
MWGLANEMVFDVRDRSMGWVRGARRGTQAARRSAMALVVSLVMIGCAGKKRAFGEAVPGGDSTEDSINSASDLPGATPATSEMGGVDDEAQGLAPLGQEGTPGFGDVLPGDAVGGQASEPCDDDGGSCMSTDGPGDASACVPTGPRDCTSDLDNDCNGQPDNALDDVCVCVPESAEPCEEHPGLDGRGQCQAGTRTCILGEGSLSSNWGPCEGSVGPGEQDSCSVAGDDTDCDGVDNGGCPCIEGEIRPCGPDTEAGICQRGTQTCVNRTFGQCVGAVFPAARNCSSNQDNDCDGRPDNAVDNVCTCTIGSVQTCGTHPGRDGNGQCQAGSQRCEGRGNNTTSTFSTCTGSVGPGPQDTCASGNDGNCNGVENEGCACVNGQTRGCGPDTDVGLCQRGTQTCVNGSFGSCQGAVFPAPRNCASAQDNDCDGRPDNTLDNVCECSQGTRRCAPGSGIPQLCSNAGTWQNQQACGGATCQDGACVCGSDQNLCTNETTLTCSNKVFGFEDGSLQGWEARGLVNLPAICGDSFSTCLQNLAVFNTAGVAHEGQFFANATGGLVPGAVRRLSVTRNVCGQPGSPATTNLAGKRISAYMQTGSQGGSFPGNLFSIAISNGRGTPQIIATADASTPSGSQSTGWRLVSGTVPDDSVGRSTMIVILSIELATQNSISFQIDDIQIGD